MSNDSQADIHEFPSARPRVKKLRLALVLFGLSVLAMVSTAFGMMMAVAADLPSLENRAEFKTARNSVLVDVRGKRLGILTSPENRILIRAHQISPAMKHAVIAVEDRRYYDHDGVDIRGVGRAFVQDVLQRKAAQGGSTIAQQFVKNALKAQADRTVFQKLRESAMAFHLDRKWSKEKILTEYLNAIYFGNGAYGVESAARTYFGREPGHVGCGGSQRPCAKELTPAEAALLAGVIASPSGYDPVSHPRAARDRRNLVLRKMMEEGYLTPGEYRASAAEAIPAQVSPPRERGVTPAAPYFTTWVKQQVVDRFGPREAFGGGLRIKTTLDLDLQKAAEQAVGARLGALGPTAALVAIDNDTGEVRAMVGGRDYNKSPFNLATQGQRQPGSAFKPFILAEALRQGIGPGSTWSSRKLKIRSEALGCDFEVNNYEDAYAGSSSLARATTFSDNAVYAQVGLKVGVGKVARLARRMGIRTPISRNCAMTLGGLRQGVTPLDMAHAYQTFATGGRFVTGSLGPNRAPVGIREVGRIKDDGDVDRIKRNKKRTRRVLPEAVAQQANSILSTVLTSGTAARARLDEFAAGKTGTTEGYGDAWFVGFTRRLTVAVWVGYADKFQPMESEYRGEPVAGGTFPAEIWRDFMLSARRIVEARVNEARARKGLAPRSETTETAPAAPVDGTATPAPAPPSEVPPEQPTPNGGDARPEETPAPAPQPAPPAPEPEPPAPAPTPGTPPPSNSGGAGSGGAVPG